MKGSISEVPQNMNPRWFYWLRANEMIQGETWQYIVWVQERWIEWEKENPKCNPHFRTEDDHKAFDAWLDLKTQEAQ